MHRDGARPRAVLCAVALSSLCACQRAQSPANISPALAALVKLPPSRPRSAAREGLAQVVRGNNALAVALYQRLRSHEGNVLVAPACLTAGLWLLHTGARGETATQIDRVLHAPGEIADPAVAYAALVDDLNADADDRTYQIRLASAVWLQRDFSVHPAYEATLKGVFALDDPRVDFERDAERACETVSAWTSERTGGRIGGMLSPASLPARTKMIMTTALYVRAAWMRPFSPESTREERFFVTPANAINVPMMNLDSYAMVHGYFDGGTFQALALPCGSRGELEMLVLLPRERGGLAALESTLTAEALDSWCGRIRRPEEIIVALPKFTLRAEVSIKRVLEQLGMPLAFTPHADFSGVNGKRNDLFVAQARQAMFLDVHEEGIEAASALQIVSPDAFGEPPPEVRADHPFLFLIRDTRSGCILFMGRVVDPLHSRFEVARDEGE